MKTKSVLLTVMATMAMFVATAHAAPLVVEVGVLANGAKFIGDGTGGARVRILDDAGRVLADGVTRGGTGSTDRIMNAAGRYADISAPGDAVFRATLDIEEPRRVTIEATGPLAHPAATSTARKSAWLVPGHEFDGANRILLTLSGYLIEPVDVAVDASGKGHVRVRLEMLCGCPVTPDGLWNANRMLKRATLVGANGETYATTLEHVGEGTVYEARFDGEIDAPLAVRIDVAGMDDDNAASRRLPLQ